VNVGAEAEKAVWDSLEESGATVVRGRIYCRGNGEQVRVYDGAIDLRDGRYIGIEVKNGSATRTADQRVFDTWVDSGNEAVGIGQANGFRIIGTRLVEVP
jgi:hypothetical protein